jgi:hypothetical protein
VDDPFWQRALLQSVGPVVTAVIGTLLFGSVAAWIARRAQDRRARYELRQQLIGELTEAASALYLHTQHYWRVLQQGREGEVNPPSGMKQDGPAGPTPALTKSTARQELDEQYLKSRVAGQVLESRLSAYFASEHPRDCWHRTMDLLTVRYFQLIDLATERLRRENAGPEHSGLTSEGLKNPKLVLRTYRESLDATIEAVLQEPLAFAPGPR